MEYVAAVNLVLRGKLVDKLKWSFKVYDNDGNGSLTNHEVRRVVKVSLQVKFFLTLLVSCEVLGVVSKLEMNMLEL